MPRPRGFRFLQFSPKTYYFKPKGIPMRMLDEVVLLQDEVEAIKLHDVDGLDQTKAAEIMKVSQPTFARILDSAYKKVADGLINGKAIRIEVLETENL
jgi:uncharacterized protein